MEPINWQEANNLIDRMNEQNFNGHNDWRLPTVKELLTLIDYESQESFADQLTVHGYVGIKSNYYWSSSRCGNRAFYAWGVYMIDGYVSDVNKAGFGYVWPIRGRLKFLKDLNSLDKFF